MPTTFSVIFLGTAADIDPTEGNTSSEDLGLLVGSTFGGAGNPLYDNVRTLSPVGSPGATYDSNNNPDQFSVNGSTYGFDGWGIYNATITYSDGTTATVVAKIAQTTTGELFLTPDIAGQEANQALLVAKPILSLTVNSTGSQGTGMTADRLAGDFVGPVDGTGGDDNMAAGYTDADGDAITNTADVIRGGDGHDDINAGDGDDVIFGGAGNDVLDDWNGNDQVYGGAGNDTANVSTGSNTLSMDGGDDLVNMWDNAGTNTLIGGDGSDTLDFTNWQSSAGVTVTFNPDGSGTFSHFAGATTGTLEGFERVTGTANADTMNASATTSGVNLAGEEGHDSLTGGSGNDTLQGDAGNDTIAGSGGEDSLSGGDGNDLLAGGAGNDILTGGSGNDTFDLARFGGSDVVTDFSLTDTDGDGKYDDQLDVSDLRDLDGNPVNAWDVTVTDDGSGNARLTFPEGETIVLLGVTPAQMQTAQQRFAAGIPCFARGTPILTPEGERAVEEIRASDLVMTQGAGAQPVIWAGHRALGPQDLDARPDLRPVHFATGSIGNDRPLRLSPQHAVTVRLSGDRWVLARARHLSEAGMPGVRIARGVRAVTYHHLMLPRHAVLRAAGAGAESFYPGREALRALDHQQRLAVLAALDMLLSVNLVGPTLREPDAVEQRYGPRALPLATRADLRAAGLLPFGAGIGSGASEATSSPWCCAIARPSAATCWQKTSCGKSAPIASRPRGAPMPSAPRSD